MSCCLLIFVFCNSVKAASFDIPDIEEEIFVGDTIKVPVYVESEDERVSIVHVVIDFPRELFWAKSFTFARGWVPVLGVEFDGIDNGKGEIVKTGGFEDTFMGRQLFGTIEFIAIRDGIAEIKPNGTSYIFDTKNESLLLGEIQTSLISISKKELDSTSSPQAVESAPSQLFDIRLELERSELKDPSQLATQVLFQSFGTVPTPVDMEFLIIDESGKIWSSWNDNTVVETEGLFTKRFPELELPIGAYTLHLNTRYAGSIVDSFHADFRIVRPAVWWWIGGSVAITLILGLAVLLLVQFRRTRDKTKILKTNNQNHGTE